MPNMSCKECKYAVWPMTKHAKPRIKTGAGRCTVIVKIQPLPLCITENHGYREPPRCYILPDFEGCPLFDPKGGTDA